LHEITRRVIKHDPKTTCHAARRKKKAAAQCAEKSYSLTVTKNLTCPTANGEAARMLTPAVVPGVAVNTALATPLSSARTVTDVSLF
jgi:hypothetical protein